MLIFGTGSYFRSRKASQKGYCPHCGKYAKFNSWNGMSFFHLYFIPLIPLSSHQRIHKCCSACNNGRTFKIEDYDALIYRLKEFSANAILALLDGEETMLTADNEPTDALEFLEGACDWFYSAADKSFSAQVLQQLNNPDCRYAEAMLSAYVGMLDGDLNKTAEFYQAACRAKPSDYRCHLRLANTLVEAKKGDQAIAAYQSAANLTDQLEMKVSILYLLAETSTKQKRYSEASQAYDSIVALQPSVMNDKEFLKLFNKAKKRSGSC